MLETPPGGLRLLGGRGLEFGAGEAGGGKQSVRAALELGQGGTRVLEALDREVERTAVMPGDERVAHLHRREPLLHKLVQRVEVTLALGHLVAVDE